jgi:electron transport complex protein RnfB
MIDPYRSLATQLDTLPNGFPPTIDGEELRLLAKLFSPEEAALAANLSLTLETAANIAERTEMNQFEVSRILKRLARRGLISCRKLDKGLGFSLMPFVVGFYENQMETMDVELAQLFENYYLKAASRLLSAQPPVHRVVPVNESIRNDMEIRSYESAISIINQAKSWGVIDCICRKQKALIGEPCDHPIDVCMVLGSTAGAFDQSKAVRSLTLDEAKETLLRAAKAGLVHSVNNSQDDVWYICNCCTCSCGILRGMKEVGVANVVARSAFVNFVNEELCIGCESCQSACEFDAILYDVIANVNTSRCVGCGLCVIVCPEGALSLIRRPENEIMAPPFDVEAWRAARVKAKSTI